MAWEIISCGFCAILGYIIGVHRGWITYSSDYQNEYDRGYNDGLIDAELQSQKEEFETTEECQDYYEARNEKAKELINQLEELFGEDDILDGGEY